MDQNRRRAASVAMAAALILGAAALSAGPPAALGDSNPGLAPNEIAADSDSGSAAADPAVIRDWNEIAVTTIAVEAAKPPAEAQMWFGFTQAAVYNAVVGITGRYEPYRWQVEGPREASPEAAAATAAYRLLSTYFPDSQPNLDAAYEASMAGITDNCARQHGVRFGERAAARIVHLRTDDGRDSSLQFTTPPAPGVWRPTGEPPVPFFAPWLSELEPLLLRTPDQFRPGPPPALASETYARELNEVKRLGSTTSTARTRAQTKTALFFSDTAAGPLQASLRDLVSRRGLDISDSARLFAAVDMSIADSTIATWDAKFHYGFWRPFTAIRKAHRDGNPATARDRDWTSLVANPPYPDHTSGLTGVIGAASHALARVLDTHRIDLYITSIAADQTRHYAYTGPLNRDAIDSRVWGGIHFRAADRLGAELGKRVAHWTLDHAFAPTD